MAFAAFFTTGCGAFLGACLLYLLGGLIMSVAPLPFSPFRALLPDLRLLVTNELRGDLATLSTFFAETVAPLRRERLRTLVSACRS